MVKEKKRLLVVLEQHFIRDDNRVYTDVQCDYNFWGRYLRVFDELIVCGRTRNKTQDEDASRYLLSSGDNVTFVPLPEFRGVSGLIKNRRLVTSIFTRCIAEADAVIFRAPSPISLALFPVVRKSNKPWAVEMMMNPRTAYSSDSMKHPLQKLIQYFAVKSTKQICLEANGVAYVTEHALQEEYPCKALVNPSRDSSAFTSSYSTIDLGEDSYNKRKIEEKVPREIVLVHTGKMVDERKGHTIFLDTIKALRAKGLDVKGILIGDGPIRGSFENYAESLGIRDACDFVGWKFGFREVQRELQRAQFMVMPTKSEGLPRAIIEAMASGLVCIGNAIDGVPELLDILCLSYNNSSLEYASIIEMFLNNWETYKEIADKQFTKSLEYRHDILAKKRTEFYEKLRRIS